MNPRELRESMGLSQVELAKKLGRNQSQISTFEAQGDWRVSTLRAYVKALGGELVLTVKWPDYPHCSACGFLLGHAPNCLRTTE